MRKFLRCLLAGTVALICTGGPAAADPPSLQLTPLVGSTTVAPGSSDGIVDVFGTFPHPERTPRRVTITYTVDYTAVSAFADLEFAGFASIVISQSAGTSSLPSFDTPCRTSGTVLTCTRTALSTVPIVSLGFYQVTPTSSATAGQSGNVTVTARVAGGAATTATGQIRIGEPVRLAASGTKRLTLAPGATANTVPRIRNAGTTPVNGTVLFLDGTLIIGPRPSNCHYGTAISCTFDTVLQPGKTYALSQPITTRVPRGVAAGSQTDVSAQWLTPATWEDWLATLNGLAVGPAGSSAPLTLVELATTSTVPQVDVDDRSGSSFPVTVAGTKRTDISAVGAHPRGKVGAQVGARFGFTNNGPGALRPDLFVNNIVETRVVLPANVSVVRSDSRCQRLSPHTFDCWPDRATTVPSGGRVLFSFTMKITKTRGATGSVDTSDWYSDAPLEHGRNPRNDIAKITATGSGASAKVTVAGLPITGTGAGLIAGVLLVAGAIGVLVAWRRRPRFRA